MVLGSILGGLLTDAFGWPSVFYVNVLLAGAAMVVAVWLLPNDTPQAGGGFDLPGAVTGTAASTLFVFALVQGPDAGWGSGQVLTSLAVAVVTFAVFLVIERRSAAPMVPLRLFGNRNLSTGAGITFLFMATFGALAYFLTQYWQIVQGYSAWTTGFAFVLPSGSVLVGTIVGGKWATRFGVRNTLFIGLTMGVVGTVVLALTLGQDVSYGAIAPSLFLLSLGQGIVFTTMFAAATTGVQPADQGIGSGIATTGQQIGGAVGLAVLIAIANSAGGGGAPARARARGRPGRGRPRPARGARPPPRGRGRGRRPAPRPRRRRAPRPRRPPRPRPPPPGARGPLRPGAWAGGACGSPGSAA